MKEYKLDDFKEERITELYPELWAIVSSLEACVLMREAAEQERPAVDALVEMPTFLRLDEVVKRQQERDTYNTFHQVVGKMCKQVMEQLGFEEDEQQGKKVRKDTSNPDIFQTGAVYRIKTS